MAKSIIDLNHPSNKKLKDRVILEFGSNSPYLNILYYIDNNAYWRRENYGVRIVDDAVDLRDNNKYSPIGGRFEHIWHLADELNNYLEENSIDKVIVLNNPIHPEIDNTQEGLVLDLNNEVTWDDVGQQYLLNGNPII